MTPLLEGALADRAFQAIDRTSKLLVGIPASAVRDPSYATGAAGLAIAHANLHAIHPARGHDSKTEELLEHARTLAASTRTMPWLVQGAAGVGWTLDYLTGDAGALLAPLEAKLERFVESTNADTPVEIFHGLAGLLVLARKRPGDLAKKILERIERSAVTVADGGGLTWLSAPRPPATPPERFTDLGFAHGVPGALAAIASCTGESFATPTLESVVERGLRSLLDARLPRGSAAAYAAHANRSTPARCAYCYGDPGVAWSLAIVARAIGNDEARLASENVARLACTRRDAGAKVEEATLCHGAAGVGHLFRRLHAHHPIDALRDAARSAFETALAMPPSHDLPFAVEASALAPGSSTALGILSGISGVALALATATGAIDEAWGEPLYVV